ncbi:MAG: hypothetical protein MZV70_62810, partial [Desulfobacterales bacterium]|nr:hypothetical protein [Desulfobacterales bacterium]
CTSFGYVLLRLNRRPQTESTAPMVRWFGHSAAARLVRTIGVDEDRPATPTRAAWPTVRGDGYARRPKTSSLVDSHQGLRHLVALRVAVTLKPALGHREQAGGGRVCPWN